MKLARLAEAIVKAAPAQMLSVQELYASLDFQGPRNTQYSIPSWHTPEFRTPDMERHEFLTGEEEIFGDLLVFHYSSHDRSMILHECSTLSEATDFVVGGAGVFNVFTDLVLVFEGSKLRPYLVTYRDSTGAQVAWDGTHKKDDRPFPNRTVQWLEPVLP
jgi:hypothetical protein